MKKLSVGIGCVVGCLLMTAAINANAADEKQRVALQAQTFAVNMTKTIKDAKHLREVYFDNGHNSGGADVIVDSDISDVVDMSAAELAALITLIEQLENFVNNAAVAQGDYGSTLSKAYYARK